MITSKFIPKSFVLMLLIAVPFFISCKDETKSEESTEVVQEEISVEQKKQMLDNAVPATDANAASGNTANVNPPHGQPGHRCDIAVGAPLDGTSANAAPTQINMQNEANATPATGEGLNPPHGQPGHRCDIQVGAPL